MTESTDATSFIRSAMPLCDTLGISAMAMTPERVELTMDWTDALCTSGGLLHGGALMALADSAGGASAFLNLPEGATGTSTIESKTNFLGGVTEGSVVATATPLHVGSTTIVVETEIRHEQRLVAKVTQTQAVLRPR
ncbi:PaaI family thioesterase [Ilumatobacter coccineus]|uniref:Thioesterase family protein n=1 Tax=Ilumatobacter coccineus (strain NBRC 103263 / KCTC 29153 / YM16-304) TaxID=1313172 RepID=A0A6C7E1W0_ILUCY|nr:PaaI family thioesterase [Ilumatobacter coccineus]BAN00880.1 thioesterase family protein [Ilumatobacter coccineus YM16-304]